MTAPLERHPSLDERADPAEAAAYATLERDLVARAPGDRLAYIDGKAAYVAALEARARRWAAARR